MSDDPTAAALTDALARLTAVREYVEHPGNWGALDGRRRLLLGLLDGEPINWKDQP
ncbi:hypothetical protein H9623_13160 [Oerskovia sp. Sa1BUA8]|uniref:Uncharacterized protein n=1 Tax=Oerskovia douganii TaxID=2762210 RepID=A0A9D5YZI7_9CELL|nr:hypothetical protein [Oerskovia douganii]MBE7701245.1 hypothetical protein [Oerskovia douganii]